MSGIEGGPTGVGADSGVPDGVGDADVKGTYGHRRLRHLNRRQRLMQRPELGSVIGLLVMSTVFLILSGGRGFLTFDGFVNVVAVASEIGIVAAFVTIVMVSGEFDIGFNAVVAAGSMIMIVMVIGGYPLWLGLILAAAIACLIATIEGVLVVRRGLPSLFVTLAVGYVVGGVLIFPYHEVIVPQINSDLRPAIRADPIFPFIGSTLPGGFPPSVIWWVVITVAVAYVLTRTSFGNWIVAIGGSPANARALGVPSLRVKYAIFFGTALGGTMLAALNVARVASALPSAGATLPFEAMVAVFIGGSRSGSGSIIGTTLGVITLAILRQGMLFAGISAYLYQLALGSALLVAYTINELLHQRAREETT